MRHRLALSAWRAPRVGNARQQWPSVFATHDAGALVQSDVTRFIESAMPVRWMVQGGFLHAWRGFAKLTDSATSPEAWTQAFCNAALADPTSPLDADAFFMPARGDDPLALSLGNRIGAAMALHEAELVEPEWQRPELTPERWSRWWECLATVPRIFAVEVETLTFVAWKNLHAGATGWSQDQARPNATLARCSLCGQQDETFSHLLTECLVALDVYVAFSAQVPLSILDLVCPVAPRKALEGAHRSLAHLLPSRSCAMGAFKTSTRSASYFPTKRR